MRILIDECIDVQAPEVRQHLAQRVSAGYVVCQNFRKHRRRDTTLTVPLAFVEAPLPRHFERSRLTSSSAFALANASACAERNLSSLRM